MSFRHAYSVCKRFPTHPFYAVAAGLPYTKYYVCVQVLLEFLVAVTLRADMSRQRMENIVTYFKILDLN